MSFFGNTSEENKDSAPNGDLEILVEQQIRQLEALRNSVRTLGTAPGVLSSLSRILEAVGCRQQEKLVANQFGAGSNVAFYKGQILGQKQGKEPQPAATKTADENQSIGVKR